MHARTSRGRGRTRARGRRVRRAERGGHGLDQEGRRILARRPRKCREQVSKMRKTINFIFSI